MKRIISLFIIIMFVSCKGFRSTGSASAGQDRSTKQVIVASYRVDCFALTAQTCYLIKQNEEDEWKFYYNSLEGFDYDLATRHGFVSRLPWLFIAGANSTEAKEAERLHAQLEKVRQSGGGYTVALELPASNLSGDKLVRGSKDVIPKVVEFVKTQVIGQQEQFPWVDRSGR